MTAVPPFENLGRYRVQSELGAGGMGTVYRAWDPQLARAVAIKVVKYASSDTRARLIREAQSLARLSHPNVCHVYDVGTEGDEVWVAMELIEGSTLRQWATKQTTEALLRALLATAEGIHAAHQAGMIHRDVKPENVLVANDGRAVVTDFGLARVDDVIDVHASTVGSGDPHETVATMTGSVAGTPAYLAPEQLTGAPTDARVDQFAWAVMTWELVTGMRPFPIIHGARLDAIRAGLTPPVNVSRRLGEALVRALAVAPRDRFASMRELIDAIGGPGIERNRMPLVIGGAVAVLAAISAFVIVWKLGAPEEEAKPAAVKPISPPAIPIGTNAPVEPAVRPTLDRRVAEQMMDAFCSLPVDPAKPDPEISDHHVIDWGQVTRTEVIEVTSSRQPDLMAMYEVKGARGTYRFDGASNINTLGVLDAKPGMLVALCLADSNAGRDVPAAWRGYVPMTAYLPLSRPPRIADLGALAPIHVSGGSLSKAATHQRISLPAGRRGIVRVALPSAPGSGTRWEIDNWWLDVPAGIPGHALMQEKTVVWIVFDHPQLVGQPDGSTQLVLRAAAIIDDMFPQ